MEINLKRSVNDRIVYILSFSSRFFNTAKNKRNFFALGKTGKEKIASQNAKGKNND